MIFGQNEMTRERWGSHSCLLCFLMLCPVSPMHVLCLCHSKCCGLKMQMVRPDFLVKIQPIQFFFLLLRQLIIGRHYLSPNEFGWGCKQSRRCWILDLHHEICLQKHLLLTQDVGCSVHLALNSNSRRGVYIQIWLLAICITYFNHMSPIFSLILHQHQSCNTRHCNVIRSSRAMRNAIFSNHAPATSHL